MTIDRAVATPATTARLQLRTRISFAIFAVVVAGIGWVGVALDRAGGATTGTSSATSTSGSTNGQGLWILVPALTALALYYLRRDGAGRLGLTLRFEHRARWFGFAGILLPVTTAVTVLVGVALGLTTFQAAPAPGKPALLAAFVAGLGFLTLKNVVEEFIFRGYGTRTAMATGLRGVAPHVLVGLVWALWHLPLYLVWTPASDRHMVTTLSWLGFFPMFFLGVVAFGVVLGELRVQTGSIWPGVLLHTLGSAIAAPLLANGHLTLDGHADALVGIQPSSITSMLIFGAMGWLLIRHRTRTRIGPLDQRP
jgi:membrane protease YdiL (CAAX protease family)